MYTVFLAGGIASGKSTVASELERLGANRIDLDQLSREVLVPHSPTTYAVARAFGEDLLDAQTGELDRRALASRAFSSPDRRALLERIELPAIGQLLRERIASLGQQAEPPAVCVVEVPLLDRALDLIDLADEVLCVVCPPDLRIERAVGRGMDRADAAARLEQQPSDAWLRAHADRLIENVGTREELLAAVRAWWDEHTGGGPDECAEAVYGA